MPAFSWVAPLAAALIAADPPVGRGLDLEELLRHLIAALLFTTIGLGFFALSWWVIVKMTPFSIRKEIEEDQNTALAIIIASVIIGIAIIVAAAIHG